MNAVTCYDPTNTQTRPAVETTGAIANAPSTSSGGVVTCNAAGSCGVSKRISNYNLFKTFILKLKI